MSKPFDYSKWDKIELSDDEEDVHPNIDKESWFRMKHRSRVEREQHEEADKKRINEAVSTVLSLLIAFFLSFRLLTGTVASIGFYIFIVTLTIPLVSSCSTNTLPNNHPKLIIILLVDGQGEPAHQESPA